MTNRATTRKTPTTTPSGRTSTRPADNQRPAGRTVRMNPRIHERKVAVARDKRHRRVLIVSGVLAVPALVATMFVLLHTSLFAVDAIHISGEVNTSTNSIVATSGLARRPPLIDVNTSVVAAKIESLPWVATAEVKQSWPRGVEIRITERMPVAEVSISKDKFELFSIGGRALGYSPRSVNGLPRIKPVADLPIPGQGADSQLVGEIAVAGSVPVNVFADIRQITVTKRDGIVAILPGRVTAIFGTTAGLRDKMTALSTLMADHVSLVGISTIDLRVPSSPVLSS